MRILLVEDDPMIGEAMAVALKDAAYAVDWVQDGVTAFNVLEHDDYQAVLLDLGLPKRDGLEVLRRLRQAGKTISVIVITARDGVDDRIKGLDFGRTTIWSSRLTFTNCWHGYGQSFAARAVKRRMCLPMARLA